MLYSILAAVVLAAPARAADCPAPFLWVGPSYPDARFEERTAGCRAALAVEREFLALRSAAGLTEADAVLELKVFLPEDHTVEAAYNSISDPLRKPVILRVSPSFLEEHDKSRSIYLFVIAHELGHARQFKKDPKGFVDASPEQAAILESQADQFAQTLLAGAQFARGTAQEGVEKYFGCESVTQKKDTSVESGARMPGVTHSSDRSRWLNVVHASRLKDLASRAWSAAETFDGGGIDKSAEEPFALEHYDATGLLKPGSRWAAARRIEPPAPESGASATKPGLGVLIWNAAVTAAGAVWDAWATNPRISNFAVRACGEIPDASYEKAVGYGMRDALFEAVSGIAP